MSHKLIIVKNDPHDYNIEKLKKLKQYDISIVPEQLDDREYIFVSLTQDGEYDEILEITRTLEEYTPSLEWLVELEEVALRIIHVLGYCSISENLVFHVAQVIEVT
tara:strand:+ start:126 stop:443 length:318 start_codon:yes stop_codon:yes gene_type:complete